MEKRDVQATGLSRLDNALAQLDPQSRQIMELWLEGVTDSDVASQLALPERVVEVIRARAFWQVRELIARQPPPESREIIEKPIDQTLQGTKLSAEAPA